MTERGSDVRSRSPTDGLAASVFSRDTYRAHKLAEGIDAGMGAFLCFSFALVLLLMLYFSPFLYAPVYLRLPSTQSTSTAPPFTTPPPFLTEDGSSLDSVVSTASKVFVNLPKAKLSRSTLPVTLSRCKHCAHRGLEGKRELALDVSSGYEGFGSMRNDMDVLEANLKDLRLPESF